jgi:D-alanyl-D-alanine carboxypeptidase/D-alanyl-D-alanine-endopeptidase (penicillin-binding protein 4)
MKSKGQNKLISFLLIFTFAIFSCNANPSGNKNILDKTLQDFSEDTDLKNASWGFYAYNITDNIKLASHNPNTSLTPASTQKLVTTITALAVLGPSYQFETALQYDEIPVNGNLSGNLYIMGTGDPTLGSALMDDSLSTQRLFDHWLKAIKQNGITHIEGSLVADGSWFDDHIIPPKWTWEDLGNYYGAGAHALTINENLYRIFFQPATQLGNPATVIKTDPELPGISFINDVTTGPAGSGDNVYIYGAPYGTERWLTGTIPLGRPGFEVKGSIPDPGLFLASSFSEFLKENGISVKGYPLTHRNFYPEEDEKIRIVFYKSLSPVLESIVERTNMKSVNTYAENLLKTLGKTKKNEGSFDAGIETITEFWKNNGVDTKGMYLHDGSGLSPFNKITTEQLTQMLVFAAQNEVIYNSLIRGLPVANQSGSLETMFSSTKSAGILMAKSGFLSQVRSYAGFTQTQSGKLIAFTLIVNNYEGSPLQMRRKMEKVMDAISQLP